MARNALRFTSRKREVWIETLAVVSSEVKRWCFTSRKREVWIETDGLQGGFGDSGGLHLPETGGVD